VKELRNPGLFLGLLAWLRTGTFSWIENFRSAPCKEGKYTLLTFQISVVGKNIVTSRYQHKKYIKSKLYASVRDGARIKYKLMHIMVYF
jgi:hypothetical protein